MAEGDVRGMAEALLGATDKLLDGMPLTTDQLGDFWQAMAEGATLRLIRLKPEMVRPWPPEHD